MKTALIGLGRTGKNVAEYLIKQDTLAMVLCRQSSPNANKDIGEILGSNLTGITVETIDHLERKLFHKQPDVLIDFSGHTFLKENIHTLAKCGVNVVTAVTDYEPAEIERLRIFAEKGNIGIVMAPNITYGVNVMMLMAEIAAELMGDYDFEVFEEHHKHKKDRPSGTAKKIVNKIRTGLLEEKEIPEHVVRAGGIVGKHKVLICGEFDKIEISHESFSRVAFAEGAYKAAKFINGKTGFYEMSDIFEYERQQRRQIVIQHQPTEFEKEDPA
ncbi:4-hydroxy-tetrahydrodipicolinate reductase [bioreactor metagenome]|uniref:4-hydroxy-tetrahydrodipicolinate reductase n=1 Tax=bioreactor metagenome TaxID=1076179 RepID=A0A644SVB0_9ZZZZ|nr:4-hydroxy-tetrahydrodipicolinate reductase [Negativicutes bacterium]